METYSPRKIEKKWQKYWQEHGSFAASDTSEKKKMYVLDMFPYPSGDGLHVGHVKIYTGADVAARYWRMRGFEVLHPTGWDAFGLPTENSAIKFGVHPALLTKRNTDRFRKQMQSLGFSYDWAREINTTDPKYYKWTQWIFLQLHKRGLAYEATVPVNWCPSCKTSLSNEEVVDGRCDRCGTPTVRKPLRQWMLKITDYAERLLADLEGLDWPEFILEMQRNWIGKSVGAEIDFVLSYGETKVAVFTTRSDTLFGATYLVLAPENPLVSGLLEGEVQNKDEVEKYVQEALHKTERTRQEEEKEKTGVELKGIKAINPATKEEIPVWIADYVLLSYGTGAIMAVPAHDERDFAFAKKFGLPVRLVINPSEAWVAELGDDLPDADQKTKEKIAAIKDGREVYVGPGVLTNSDKLFDGMRSEEAREAITTWLEKQGKGRRAVSYKMRDWVFSRQRYWGEPIPIIHCGQCGAMPVPEEDLPVRLPEVERYEPTGTGESPLAGIPQWVNVKCPQCGGEGKRETNTMPQWAGSSWYFLRYTDPKNDAALADQEKLGRWMPVDLYVGGAEHAVLHLLYARFWHKVLHDEGIVNEGEPFIRLRNVGLVLGSDGVKMSKSRGNVVNPDGEVERHGADAVRVFAMFMGPFDDTNAWATEGMAGAYRFLRRVSGMFGNFADRLSGDEKKRSDESGIQVKLHQTIKRVTESTESFRFNTAISALMEMLNLLEQEEYVSKRTLGVYALLLSPYAPHLAEELWQQLGHADSLMYHPWPTWDEQILAGATRIVPVQVNGKVRGTLLVDSDISREEILRRARTLPNVAKYLAEGETTNVVYVPGRLINFVVKSKS